MSRPRNKLAAARKNRHFAPLYRVRLEWRGEETFGPWQLSRDAAIDDACTMGNALSHCQFQFVETNDGRETCVGDIVQDCYWARVPDWRDDY